MMGVADIKDRIAVGQAEGNGELSQEIAELNKEWRSKRDNYRSSSKKVEQVSPNLETLAATQADSTDLIDNGLAEAAASGRLQDCRRILQHTRPNVWAKDGTTPLCAAALWGQSEALQLLLEAKADTGLANRSGLQPTALHAAALQEHGKICMILLGANADPHAKDRSGVTPADYAACSEALWPHFQAVGCSRPSKEHLINMGVIRKASPALEVELEALTEDNSYMNIQNSYADCGDKGNKGLLTEFSRPGSAYVVTAHHPPRPGSAAVPNYSRSNSGLRSGSRSGTGSRRMSQAIDILAEGDEKEALGKENDYNRLSQSQQKLAAGYAVATGSLRSLGL
jgi:hypothetical protein